VPAVGTGERQGQHWEVRFKSTSQNNYIYIKSEGMTPSTPLADVARALEPVRAPPQGEETDCSGRPGARRC
jgi:hypothetical protein